MNGSDPDRAAAVCMGNSGKVLLVRTKDGARWTFPKGRVERGETPSAAAAREAREEAGVFGEVDEDPLFAYRYPKKDHTVVVQAYLLRVSRQGPPEETFRNPTWFTRDDAVAQLAENREPWVTRNVVEALRTAVERFSGSPPLQKG